MERRIVEEACSRHGFLFTPS